MNTKLCPVCNNSQVYSDKYKLWRAIKNKSICGECSRKKPSKKRQDLTENVYGRLKVLSFYEKRGKQQYWKCKCNCGNETIIGHTHLTKQTIRSCGCSHFYLKDKHPSWLGIGKMSGSYFSQVAKSAKKRNFEFKITKEDMWNLFLKQNECCALTGIKLKFDSSLKNRDGNASLDRINSKRGYIIDNIQWIHKIVNIMKRDLEEKEFFKWCKLISERNFCET